MRGATVGANQDAWADDMAQVNRMGAEGAERQQVIQCLCNLGLVLRAGWDKKRGGYIDWQFAQ